MKKIIVPTDFSKASKEALRFAFVLAEHQDVTVQVVHAYHPEQDTETNWMSNSFTDALEVAKKHLASFVESGLEYANESGVTVAGQVEQKVITGFAADEILKLAVPKSVEMVVMGSTGKKGFLEKMFGSVSTNVAQKAKSPVMFVPEGVHFQGFRHILFASDYEAIGRPMLRKLVSFAQRFEADLHFVHVETASKTSNFKDIETRLLDMLSRNGKPALEFQMSQVESSSVVEGLNQYVTQNNINLLVMVRPHRDFLENLFHKSVTKAMTLNTRIPMLILHE